MEANSSRPTPKWLDVDAAKMEARVLELPNREDIDFDVAEHLPYSDCLRIRALPCWPGTASRRVTAHLSGSRSSDKIKAVVEATASRPTPKWLDVDAAKMEARVLNLPDRGDIDFGRACGRLPRSTPGTGPPARRSNGGWTAWRAGGHHDQGRDPHPPQRLPSAQAPQSINRRCFNYGKPRSMFLRSRLLRMTVFFAAVFAILLSLLTSSCWRWSWRGPYGDPGRHRR